jgi:hypothetical protein
VRCSWVILVAAMVVGCSDADRDSKRDEARAGVGEWSARLSQPRVAANIFYSGHSLMDQPLPDFVQKIAESLSTQIQWNRQYVVGSSILRRGRGTDSAAAGAPGYQRGSNRGGEGLDVVAELREPKTIAGSYDVLVITEEHTLLETLLQSDTVRQLRHYHERFTAGNPNGQTFLYEPWYGIDDKSNPARWIEYERAASPIWQCVATRINVSLAAEGRSDRLISLPAGAALADLIDRATRGEALPSITRASVRETVDSIVKDDVHLTPLGVYYISLVTYSSVYQRPATGAWHSDFVTEAQAASLQAIAWDFVSRYYESYRPLSLEECTARLLHEGHLALLWQYIREAHWHKKSGALRSYARYLRRFATSQLVFRSESVENPFYFDPATDKAYWHSDL